MTTQTRDTTLRDRAFLIESVVSNFLWLVSIIAISILLGLVTQGIVSMILTIVIVGAVTFYFRTFMDDKREAFRLWIWDTLDARKKAFPNE